MKRKRFAVVVGLDYHAKFLADLVNEHSKTWTLRAFDHSRFGTLRAVTAMRRADALICFGGPAPNSVLTEAAHKRNVPAIVIWAGSDIIKARENPFELEVVKQERFVHLAVAPWLVDELHDLGVEAAYVPVAGMPAGDPVVPFPAEFRVLTYLPEPRRDFYGAPLVYDLARALPDVPFDVVGAGEPSPLAPKNVRFLGEVHDMPRRIDECAVLLRQPKHDGLSMLVMEALSRARHVVWNYDFPHVRNAATFEAILRELADLRRQYEQETLELNHEGRTFALNNFGRRDVALAFMKTLDEALEKNPPVVRRAHRVAISGLGLFCGEIAQQARMVSPRWEPCILRTNSRLEVVTSIVTLLGCDVWYSIGSPVTDRWLHLAARLLRKPRVIHWVGSDIASLGEDTKLRKTLAAPNVLHLAEISWTAEQLHDYGLNARIAPLPPRHRRSECLALPEQFTIMLYVPRTRSDFYGRAAFQRLMERLADKPVRYLIVGGGEIDIPPGVDAQNLGWRDSLSDVYAQATALIRYTPRDGLSLMVLEALSFGRHVLWTQQFPYVRRIGAYADIERHVLELLAAHERGELQEQRDASRLIEQQYGSTECTREIVRAWEDAIRARAHARFAVEGT